MQAFQEVLGAKLASQVDEPTIEYLQSIIDATTDGEEEGVQDILSTMVPILQNCITERSEKEIEQMSRSILKKLKPGLFKDKADEPPKKNNNNNTTNIPNHTTSNGHPASKNNNNNQNNNNQFGKVLNAPIVLSVLAKEQDAAVKTQLRGEMPAEVNVNKSLNTAIEAIGLDQTLSDRDQREGLKKLKKELRKERKDTSREKRTALERDEIIRKLSNRPVKIHSSGKEEAGRIKDIKLEGVSMTLASLELLLDTSIVFSEGRKYGLVGRNGIGKTTFLKHLVNKLFPGIPGHLQILHIEQEVQASDQSVLKTVLATDFERDSLLEEAELIQKIMEQEDHPQKPQEEPSTPTPTSPVIENGKETAKTAEDNKPKEGAEEQQQQQEQQQQEEQEDEEEELRKQLNAMTAAERSQRLLDIFQRLQEIDSDAAPPRAAAILAGLGFTPSMQQQATKQFSGGWRMRVALAQALFISPDILLLDEPTNHLDLHAVLWLEEYLRAWDRTLLVVSHDRDFLNSVVTDIVHMQNKKLFRYKGDYDNFEKQRVESAKLLQKEKENQDKEIAQLQVFIDKNRVSASTAKMAQSRIKKLAKIEILPEIARDPQFQFHIPEPDPLPQTLVSLVDVTFGYQQDRILYTGVNLSVDMSTRAALVGANGVGKSTLLKLILGEILPISGMVKVNPKARIARFTQHHVDQLDMKKSPLEWFKSMYPDAKPQDIRKHLGGMGLTGNLALQPIYSLSGGQKSRVAFAHITWMKPQLLLLDEPTNHLDMDTIDALIHALNQYEGGVLVVSHDAHLISTVVDQIWVCEHRKIHRFDGDFDDYRKSLIQKL